MSINTLSIKAPSVSVRPLLFAAALFLFLVIAFTVVSGPLSIKRDAEFLNQAGLFLVHHSLFAQSFYDYIGATRCMLI